jgi:hypothetical protein
MLDRILITFDTSFSPSAANAAISAGAFTIQGYQINRTALFTPVSGTSGYISILPNGNSDTGATPLVTYNAALGPIGTVPSDTGVNATDRARPVMLQAYGFAPASPALTYFNVEFSEAVYNGTGPVVIQNFFLDSGEMTFCGDPVGNAGGFDALTSMLASDGSVRVVSITTDGRMFLYIPDMGNLGPFVS